MFRERRLLAFASGPEAQRDRQEVAGESRGGAESADVSKEDPTTSAEGISDDLRQVTADMTHGQEVKIRHQDETSARLKKAVDDAVAMQTAIPPVEQTPPPPVEGQ